FRKTLWPESSRSPATKVRQYARRRLILSTTLSPRTSTRADFSEKFGAAICLANSTNTLSWSILQHFFDSVRHFFGLVHDFFHHLFQLFAGGSIHIHFALLGFGEKFGIFQSSCVCLPQDLNPFRRDSRSCHHRASQFAARQYHLRH